MSAKPTRRGVADLGVAVARFQRLRASKSVHATLVAAIGTDITQQSLQLLVAADDGQTSSQLAKATNMDPAAVSRELGRLEDAGLVERRPSPHHHAGIVVHLTGDGRKLRERIIEVRTSHLARALDGWSRDEVEELTRLLERFVDDLISTPLDR